MAVIHCLSPGFENQVFRRRRISAAAGLKSGQFNRKRNYAILA
jgi:hypothetical protein